MFKGFTKDTLRYFSELEFNNSMQFFDEHKSEYEEHVKKPMIALYEELAEVLSKIDSGFELRRTRCISSPFADLRFSRDNPLKGYFYIRFRLQKNQKQGTLGFFFDASNGGARYGLKVYDVTASGMQKIREAILDNLPKAEKIMSELEKDKTIIFERKPFAKDHYPQISESVKSWLNSRKIDFYHSLSDINIFLSSELKDKIAQTYNSFKEIFMLIKNALEF